jgi:hypothetical protein
MPTFSSSAVTRAEYDPETRVLRIWFAGSEGRYDYADVPPQAFEELCRAPSKGRYVSENIRDAYATQRHPDASLSGEAGNPGSAPPSLLSQLRASIAAAEAPARAVPRKAPFPRRPPRRRK